MFLLLLLALLPATMTTYVDSDATTVYVIRSSLSELTLNMPEGEISYCVTDRGEAECEWANSSLVLRGGNGVSSYIVKISRPLSLGQFIYYNEGLNVSKHEIYLPEGAEVYEIYPSATGSNPYVWRSSSPIYSVHYSTPSQDWLLPAAGVILAACMGAIYYFLVHKKPAAAPAEGQMVKVMSSLPKHERDVLALVFGSEGIRQNELQAKLSLNKAHLSKLIGRMEARFLLRRERIGRLVKVYLGDFFTKKP